MHELDFHPLANAFPGLAEEALLELAHDIEAHGQLEPIVLFEGRILDGRQRWLACRMAGVEPQMIDWPGPGEPVAWVISKNLRRRHLSDSQRAMVAARLANLSWGQNKREVQICTSGRDVTRDEAAALLNVSARSVAYARKLQASGDQELQAAVDRGEVSLHDAMSAAELPPDAQREALRAQRSGQARTLRAAVGAASCRFTDEQNQAQAAPRDASPSVGEAPANEPPSIAEVCEALERELGKFARRLDELALARGGDDELAQLARRGLSIVKQALGKMGRRVGR